MKFYESHFVPFTVSEPGCCTAQTSPNCSDKADQIVVLPARRRARPTGLTILDRGGVTPCLASMSSGKQRLRWTVNLPVWFSTEDLHLRLNAESQQGLFSHRPPKELLACTQTLCRMPSDHCVVSVKSLCHPALRERTLRRLSESGGLQVLIDQWDHSSLEELEAFIDSYFEMVWEQTMGSFQAAGPDDPAAEQCAIVEVAGHEEVLSSIDRKLSKLELLDEIKRDLVELRTGLENIWQVIQETQRKNETK